MSKAERPIVGPANSWFVSAKVRIDPAKVLTVWRSEIPDDEAIGCPDASLVYAVSGAAMTTGARRYFMGKGGR